MTACSCLFMLSIGAALSELLVIIVIITMTCIGVCNVPSQACKWKLCVGMFKVCLAVCYDKVWRK